MQIIQSRLNPSVTLCVVVNMTEASDYRQDLSRDESSLQVSLRNLSSGIVVSRHSHKQFERTYEIPNESWLIFRGKVKAILYDVNDELIDELTLSNGDLAVFYNGGHSLEVVDDNTIFLEHKSGPYFGVENDKRNF